MRRLGVAVRDLLRVLPPGPARPGVRRGDWTADEPGFLHQSFQEKKRKGEGLVHEKVARL